MHREIFKIIDRRPGDPGYKPLKCLIAPRGTGKTSISSLLVPAIAILLQRFDYIVIIGYNAGDAIEKTEALKYKLVNNELVKALYGDITTEWWSKEEFVVKIGSKLIKVHPRGSQQPVRGRLWLDSRPGLIIVDDLEKAEETESAEQREKKKTWLFADPLNAIDRGLKHRPGEDPPWEILVVGTILHQDSLLINLHESDNWDSTLLEICDDHFVSNAPTFLSNVECRTLYEQLKDDNELDVWYREYRNNPVPSGEDAAFQPRFYKYYSESDSGLNFDPNVESVVIVDPSRTAKFNSAPTGIVGWGIDTENHKLYYRDGISRKMFPEEMYDEIASMITRLDARVLGVEVTGLHEFITHPLKTFLSKRGISVEFIDLHARKGADEKGKRARVRGLVDFYREGMVYHSDAVAGPFEQQLGAFPKAKDWSLMDPSGYIVELLEKGGRYLSFPGTGEFRSAREVERDYRDLEAMYKDLDEYAPLDDFRVFN
jgi:hypothetical protein